MTQIVGLDGKPIQHQRDLPCPKCGAGPDQRTPSSGFGTGIYLVCTGKGCAHEFKELSCPVITP